MAIIWLLPAIGALIWTVRRSGIFPAQLNDSELIRGSLTIIRIQRLVDEEKLRDTDLLENYIGELGEYAENEGFRFIDFTGEDWLQRKHYTPNDHLKSAGKQQFTREIYRQLNQTD